MSRYRPIRDLGGRSLMLTIPAIRAAFTRVEPAGIRRYFPRRNASFKWCVAHPWPAYIGFRRSS